jgi:large exoprotein involved in heme utilization and adhesion
MIAKMIASHFKPPKRYARFLCGSLVFFHGILPLLCYGQLATNIQPEAGNPTNTSITTAGNITTIDQGIVMGPNQVHGLDKFDVGTGHEAHFPRPGGVDTTLVRVSGGHNFIDGLLRTFGQDLVLINKDGTTFMGGATLDIGETIGQPGSFYATSAEVVTNADGTFQFHAMPGQGDVLSTASWTQFGFGQNPAPINVQGSQLRVAVDPAGPMGPQGKTLALIGGEISVASDPNTGQPASLTAPSGYLVLASTSVPGTVTISDASGHASINAPGNEGTISVKEGSTLDVSDNFFEGDGHNGTVHIVGGEFHLEESQILSQNFGPVDGPETAVKVELEGDMTITSSEITVAAFDVGSMGNLFFSGQNLTVQGASGITAQNFSPVPFVPGGDFIVEANRLSVLGGSQLINFSFVEGPTGNINLSLNDSLTISGFQGNQRSRIGIETLGNGTSGIIDVQANSVLVDNLGIINTISGAAPISGNMTFDLANLKIFSGGRIFTEGGNGSGTITINAIDISIAGQFDQNNRSIIENTGGGAGGTGATVINTSTFNMADNGRIRSNANDQIGGNIAVSATDSATISSGALIGIDAGGNGLLSLTTPTLFMNQGTLAAVPGNVSKSADIHVKTNQLNMVNGSQIKSSTSLVFETGQGGNITVEGLASPGENFIISGQDSSGNTSGIFATTENNGPGGNITVITNQFTMEQNAQISTGSLGTGEKTGAAGTVNIQVNDHFQLNSGASVTSNSTTQGNSGTVNVAAGNFLSSNGIVSTSATLADGGNVTINASGNVLTSNATVTTAAQQGQSGNISITAGQDTLLTNNSLVSSQTSGPGTGGNITVQGNQVLLTNGATVSAQSTSATPGAAGNGGNVTINATGNVLTSNATVTTAAQEGQSGNISINGGQNSLLTNNTTVSTRSFGNGNAGDITVGGGNGLLVSNSSITAQADQADGGNIKLNAGSVLLLLNSVISSSVNGGPGTVGGNINIDPLFILGQNVQIRANAVEGQGGNITLIADAGVFFDTSSVLDASSQLGIDGSIDVQAPIINLSGIVTPLPQGTLKVAKMYAERCAAQKGGQFSSFVQGGRDGLPPSPGGFMPSPLNMSLPQSFSSSPALLSGSSETMVKRLGMEAASDLAKHSHWVIGDTVQGCAA